VALALAAPPAPAASPSSQPAQFPVVEGSVHAVLVDGGTAYVGGSFTSVGPMTGPMAILGAGDGALRQAFPELGAAPWGIGEFAVVDAIEPDGAGGWYVGGHFGRAAGEYRAGLVHLRSDGSVDPDFRADVAGRVHALALYGDTLWVGGNFASIGGEARSALAAVDAVSGTVRSWLPRGAASSVNDLAVAGDRLYVAGSFSSIGGDDGWSNLAAVDAGSGHVLDWAPAVNGAVSAIDVAGDVVYAVGTFSRAGGAERDYAVALRASDASAMPADFGLLELYPTDIVATEEIVVMSVARRLRDGDRAGLAAFEPETGALLPQFADVKGGVTLERAGNVLYASDVGEAAGQTRNGLAAFDLPSGTLRPWTPPRHDGRVLDLAVAGHAVAIGGLMRSVGVVPRKNLAAIDLATGAVTGFDPVVDVSLTSPNRDGQVNALAKIGDELYIGGGFGRVGGQWHRHLAAVDATTGRLLDAVPDAGYEVHALAATGSTLYVGGNFRRLGAKQLRGLGAIDLATGQPADFAPEVDCRVTALAVNGDTLHAGGCFRTVDGLPRRHLAAFSIATGGPSPVFTAEADGWDPTTVHAIVPDEAGGVWVGGSFNTLGGLATPYLGHLDAFGVARPDVPAADGELRALALGGGLLYLAGGFRSVDGSPRGGIAAVRVDDSTLTPFDPQPDHSTWTLTALPGGAVLAGGAFMGTELASPSGLARFAAAPAGGRAPVVREAPAVIGDRFVGGVQFTDGGQWDGPPTRLRVEWLRCDAAGEECASTGAIGEAIQLAAADAGHRLRVEVTALNDHGASTPARSPAGPLVAGEQPRRLEDPIISGNPRPGEALTSSSGAWTGTPTRFAYRWLRCPEDSGCRTIAGADGPTLLLRPEDAGQEIRTEVTAENAAGASRAWSAMVGPVEGTPPPRRPANSQSPAIAGEARTGTELRADPGRWTEAPSGFDFAWLSCDEWGARCRDLGARGAVYVPARADSGRRLRVSVVARNGAGESHAALSRATGPVADAPPEPTATPTPEPTATATPPTPTPEPTATATATAEPTASAMPTAEPSVTPAPPTVPAGGSAPSLFVSPIAPLPPTVRVAAVRLAEAVRRGALVRLRSSTSGTFVVTLRRPGGKRVLGRRVVPLAAGRWATVRIRIRPAARRQLRARPVHLVAIARRVEGGLTAESAPVRLRR
jgi:hypothetical protein